MAQETLVPSWVGWTPFVLYPLATYLLCRVGARLGVELAARPWRGITEGPWVDRARRAYPVRVASGAARTLPIAGAAYAFYFGRSLGASHRPLLWFLAALTWLAGFVAILPEIGRAERRVLGLAATPPGRWRRLAAFALVARPYWLVVLPVAVAMPERLTPVAFGLLALTALLLYRLTRGDGLRLARLLGLAVPASPRLLAAVRRAAERTSARPGPAYEMPSLLAAAFALPSAASVVVTDRALAVLDDEELEVVCGHELGHVAESGRVIAARSASAVWLLPLAAAKPLVGSLGLGPYLVFLLLTILFGRSRLGWSRRLEQRADAIAHDHEPSAGVYARALARLYETDLLPMVGPGAGRTHPHLYDRLVAAGAPPDFPRPAKPSRLRGSAALVVSLSTVAIGWMGLPGLRPLMCGDVSSDSGALWSLALGGGDALGLSDLALVRSRRGDWEAAARLYRAALELEPGNRWHARNLAITLRRLERCPAAVGALDALEVSREDELRRRLEASALAALADCRDAPRP